MVLPGDGMFQAQRIVNGKCRPVILHGYGGAKKEMPTSLMRIWQNLDGPLWQLPWLARRHPPRCGLAKIGDPYLIPRWTPGILPPHLSNKESLLLLSQWIRIPRDDLHITHATNSLAVS